MTRPSALSPSAHAADSYIDDGDPGPQSPDDYGSRLHVVAPEGAPEFLTPPETKPAEAEKPPVADLPAFMDGDWDDETPQTSPTLLAVEGGYPLLYQGHSHSISGPGGGGKTWTCQHCIAELVRTDSKPVVVFIDYEGNRASFRERLKNLGVTKAQAGRIAYWSVSTSLMKNTAAGKRWLEWVDEHKPSFVALDSVSKACAAAGLDDESNPQFQQWDNGVIVPLTERGVTSLRIDHTGHDDEVRGHFAKRARGASAKKDAVSGASYLFRTREAWTRDSDGVAELTCLKDRHGHHKANTVVAIVNVTVEDGGKKLTFTLSAPTAAEKPDGNFRPTWYMERLSAWLEKQTEAVSLRKCLTAPVGKAGAGANKAVVEKALRLLRDEGFIAYPQGKPISHVKAYLEEADPAADKYVSTEAPI